MPAYRASAYGILRSVWCQKSGEVLAGSDNCTHATSCVGPAANVKSLPHLGHSTDTLITNSVTRHIGRALSFSRLQAGQVNSVSHPYCESARSIRQLPSFKIGSVFIVRPKCEGKGNGGWAFPLVYQFLTIHNASRNSAIAFIDCRQIDVCNLLSFVILDG